MDSSISKYIERMLEISSKKYTLLQDIYLLTQAQAEVLTEEGVEALEIIVSDKQRKIDAINKIDEEFNVYYSRFKQTAKIDRLEELGNQKIEGIKELQDLIAGIMELINEISEVESENNKKAKTLLNSIGDEIKKINQGRKANNVYASGTNIQSTSYFIDKKK